MIILKYEKEEKAVTYISTKLKNIFKSFKLKVDNLQRDGKNDKYFV